MEGLFRKASLRDAPLARIMKLYHEYWRIA